MSEPRCARRESARCGKPAYITDQRTFAAPLTIGVLSDTHLYPGTRAFLPREIPALFDRFGCGLILHAGDCCTVEMLEPLGEVAPLLVVVGNNDIGDLKNWGEDELAFMVGERRAVLLHGHGGRSARMMARKHAVGNADLVVYGHSHIPKIELVEGTILFNPGSPTDRRWTPHFGIGVITITDQLISPELILFSDPRELAAVRPV